MLDPLPSGWQTLGSCHPTRRPHRLTVDDWFPDDGDTTLPTVADLCATCPVRAACLEDALDAGYDTSGVWAGVGVSYRRELYRLRLQSPHRYRSGCGCQYCETVAAVFSGRVLDRNGSGATCGRTSTYGRGCRCGWCTMAAVGRSSRRAELRVDPDLLEAVA